MSEQGVRDMSEGSAFDRLKRKVGEQSERIEHGVDKVKDFAKQKTGGKYDHKIDKAGDKATEYLSDDEKQNRKQDGSGEQGGSGDQGQR
ncbi:antitoxin [Streptomonospora wellingtoniae]|uniref:Antitoxin n=1 Tax=Streptomonospora wellingtoniae TaxID=3075544 RepID=A0ABU2KPK8_9ACTN|nr:antitoxin [Streptomonospora sp. DSM 45055]MDT0301220.1 antitoxin [Streptomonospora sp. DSM 45055]